MTVFHNSQLSQYRNPFGAIPVSSSVSLSVLAPEASEVSVRLWTDSNGETMVPMKKDGDYHRAEITAPDYPCLLWYFFVIRTDSGIFCYGNAEDMLGGEGCITYGEPHSYQITVYEPSATPKWYKDALVYQIFPDRFFRGSDCEQRIKNADLPGSWKGPSRTFEEDWYCRPEYTKNEAGEVTEWKFYGGTLKGIEEKLPYIHSLGMTAIYLNPVFRAASNHRYDTADYFSIDPLLGDEQSFRSLCAKASDYGIRIILDGVFNHTGADSIYFDMYGNYGGLGAYGRPDSEYRSWYTFNDSENGYESWWGVKDLPSIRENDPSYRKMICGNGGVISKWLSEGASGWRLDVADELPDSFIEDIKTACRNTDSDSLLIGEVWEDASNKISYGEKRKYFSGHELDGVMNYPFRNAAVDFTMNRITSETFRRIMMSLYENYPPENFYGSLNLIDGHDRMRIMTVLGEAENIPECEKRHFMLSEWYYAIAKKRLKMLSSLQYAMPGVPCLYYGDETGMQGHADPYNRAAFPWGREDTELQHHYRMLGIIYKEHPVLKNGDFKPFTAGDDVFGVIRSDDSETVITAVNRHYTEHILIEYETDCEYALELLTSKVIPVKDGKISYMTEPLRAAVILLQKNRPCITHLKRSAGVICHISALPGGTLGRPAEEFCDFLSSSGIKLWQILPLNPTGLGNSPYHSPAVFAGNTCLTDRTEKPEYSGLDTFIRENRFWLDDFALYTVLKRKNDEKPWQEWQENERDRTDLSELTHKNEEEMLNVIKDQYVFFRQWDRLLEYAHSRGIKIIGDMPVYVAPDSCDLWACREYFNVDEHGHLLTHAGVPPDSFTPEGQDWGNPLYNWKKMKESSFSWWMKRFEVCSRRFDYIRLDHFRSFSEYFSVPERKSPREGLWMPGAGIEFFREVQKRYGNLGIIAEDLGILDTGVFNLLKLTGFPGMDVWQFTADEMQAMPDEIRRTRIFCSGTHDNHTLVGFYKMNRPEQSAASEAEKAIEYLFGSASPWVIIPIQDMLLLDDDARLNTPGTCNSINWTWRAEKDMLNKEISEKFRKLTERNGR